MELLQGLEVYIPPEAEVKSVPLLALSSSVRRKMGLSAGLDSLPDSPLCMWISPALFQRKGQKDLPQGKDGARQQVLSMLGNRQACPSLTKGYGQCKMTFVTAHSTAYKVLKETLPMIPNTRLCSAPTVPLGALPDTEQDAVIIHQGRVYLSVKKAKKRIARPHSSAGACSTVTGQVAPVIHNKLKRRQDSLCEGTNKSQPKPSGSQQRATQSQGSSAVATQCHSDSVWAGCSDGGSKDQEPPEESSDQRLGLALAPYSDQHSHTESSALLALHSSGSKMNIDFDELASRERIAVIKSKLDSQ
ncbi:hypothetical protein NQD34_004837 [Periophthalmus magnuspinnatus]|uniref:uncharacterized protein si:dkeyp-110g5.4 n=1 Tax=Periophthalmus magnuspinnatus TaxID=409849 RepID=UPI00145B7FD6|nr:uncharacterized protein si:dkeyp-110g5.4 [Periophthalmus magnuspinnatus]KAJ0036160.1 hypothetical protein NQD34_004837 [Periophthalmus magnuspinnatus]